MTVASYNVLNLDPTSADDNQRATLASQIANNLGGPDVVALQEIQDNDGADDDGDTEPPRRCRCWSTRSRRRAVPSTVLRRGAGEHTSGGAPGGNIRNAFLYNPDRVELVDFESLTPDVLADLGVTTRTRSPARGTRWLATFKFRGKEFTVVNNHLTSRFGSTPMFGGPQPFVQAGETERAAQTGALNEVTDALIAQAHGNPIHASKAGRVMVRR